MKGLVYISNWLYLVALSLWLGGMFLLGILVEIIVRMRVKDPILSSNVMNGIMDVFNTTIIYGCIKVMVVTLLIVFLVDKFSKKVSIVPRTAKRGFAKEIMLIIMIVLAIYIGSILRPEMHAVDKLKKASPGNVKLEKKFDGYHGRLVWLYTVNMVLGLSLFFITGKEMTRFENASPKQQTGDKG
jgi:Na+/H+ antiporter NhaC